MRDIVILDSKNVKMRAVLIAAILFAIAFGWYSIRWQLGDMLAGLTQASDPNVSEIAELAVNWAPADPSAYSLKASAGDDTAATIVSLEQAVRRSPYDYRWRTELGRAYEQDEQVERAEAELKKAVELAPSYASPRWYLGNFYLRQERGDEAIAELKKAAANNQIYRDQVFSLAWDYFNRDAAQIETLAGDRADLRAFLAYFFAARGRAEDALRNWNKLSEQDKDKNAVTARAIALGLFDQRHFPQALEFSRSYGGDRDAKPEAVTNGSFEKNIGETEDARFDWLIVRGDPKLDITPDSKVKHEGNRSLRLTFKGYNKPDLANLFQTVVVEPGKRYRLHFWIRTENLKTAGGPMIEINNANDDKTIARSQVFPSGTNDWQEMSIDFTAPAGCSGINMRTIRAACGENCPIAGIIWYDDAQIGEFE